MNFDAVLKTLTDKLWSWFDAFVSMLPNLVVAVLALFAFYLMSRAAQNLAAKTLEKTQTHKAVTNLLATFVKFGVLVLGVVVALGVLDLDKTLASVLAGAGVVGVALGFAFQDLAGNLISGVGLAVNRTLPFKIGDIVDTNGTLGVVRAIQLRTSVVETLDGKTVVIPNKKVFQGKVTNYTLNGRIRVDVDCGVTYGEDLAKVHKVAKDAIADVEPRRTSQSVELFFTEFGASSINFVVRFWIDYDAHVDFLNARNEAIMRLKAAFDENDITIPFPIRTLDFPGPLVVERGDTAV